MRTFCVVERVSYLVDARSPAEAYGKLDRGVVVKGRSRGSVRERTVIERHVTEMVCGPVPLPGAPTMDEIQAFEEGK
ncbi:MAG: hypothetical protein ACYCZN_01680 [Candidatus Dormibacteria bacterium]